MVERFDRDCSLAHWLNACDCPAKDRPTTEAGRAP